MSQSIASAPRRAVDRLVTGIQRHWLAGITIFLGALLGVAMLTPLAYAFGFSSLGDSVFHLYRFMCGQTPSHSFFLGGYQMCLCSRCMAIYSSMLIAGVAFGILRNARSLRPARWYWWVLGMVPMALDGGTQLFGWHESNLALRLLTGAVFGLSTAWFLFPQIEESTRF